MNFTEAIELNIDKLVGTLKDEDELEEVLKKKFTKKEFKVFVAFSEGKTIDEVKTIVNDDEERINEIYKTACKKLNQEKIKKELVFFK
jgi:DNA-directed RNA polymerase sigma subunit (sigma70/sigma32)